MHSKTLARPLICSLFLALPLTVGTVGCVAEWHAEDDGFDDDDDDNFGNDGSCVCDDDDDNGGNDNGGNGGSCPSTADGAIYVGTDSSVCSTIGFTCPETHTSFNDACGCGCETIPMEEPVCPTEDGEGITRVSRDLKVCNSIQFTCPEGSDPFNGTCGCGCIAETTTSTPTCPDPEAPNVHYLGEDGSAVCEMIAFTCPGECVQFNDECGCGCIEP